MLEASHYNAETSAVAFVGKNGLPPVVPARDAFWIEVGAVRNAAAAAATALKGDGKAMAALMAVENVYYGLYMRKPGQPHPTAADFGEMLKLVSSDPSATKAWAVFSQCLALAVPLQHCVNTAMMAHDGTVDAAKAGMASALALAMVQMPDREFAAEMRAKVAEGGVTPDVSAVPFLADPQTAVVAAALEFAVEQLQRQRKAAGHAG